MLKESFIYKSLVRSMDRFIRATGGKTVISVIPRKAFHINYDISILFYFFTWTTLPNLYV